ncbi:MAG: FolC bifunctional protein [Verrucomicrobiales bacterium]|nr:FolC bifunctional protein [Verrucomicrobiales bacterium]
MLYTNAIEFLYSLRLFGAKLGLENTRRLAALAGNPQDRLRFIHVAGTNGKGSTCAMLESIYRSAGLKTGLFTSPHLVSFRERLQVNRQLISEQEVVKLVEKMQAHLEQFPRESHPTFFEVVTVMGLEWFAGQKCDIVIWETGLGGRLDATNIVMPLASVITNIDFDHQQWLGDSLEKIAAEKAGIIKSGIPVITAAEPAKGLEVIKETASKLQAPLTVAAKADADKLPLIGVDLPLSGDYQKLNAATAIATVEVLASRLRVSKEAVRRGLNQVHWPGRMQTIRTSHGQTILLDGAHNPGGATLLAEHLRTCFPDQKLDLILGILGDKDSSAMAHALLPIASRIFLPPVKSERALPPADLAKLCRSANPQAEVHVTSSLQEALALSQASPILVITGSLYLIGEAMELLDLSPAGARNEQGLNEYGARLSSK